MKYKLYSTTNKSNNMIKQVLYNRGINDVDTYLNLNKSIVIDYNLLDNIKESVELFDKHYQQTNCIGIIPDSDVDGQCSSAEIFLYIKRMNQNYPIKIIYHTKPKAHGLSDVVVPSDVKLLIVADAGTNDTKECKKLKENGIDVLILDHHEQEEENPYALIVNNQCSNKYSNKQLCGGGIVYRWLQALDDYYWNDFADDYLDLVALANISDVMDLREFETRYFVNCGLLNIENKFIKSLINAQSYSMKDKVSIHNVQWYLSPIINALLRVGTQEEKELLFRAFIEQDEYFEYKKRATKDKPAEVIQESIYDRVARLCKNAKSRQDKKKEKSVEALSQIIDKLPVNDKVIVLDTGDLLDRALTGVVAIKLAEKYNKPCILVKKHIDDTDKKNVKITYGGSARNIDHSPIDSFKDVVNNTYAFNFANGHPNAFGVDFDIDKIDEIIDLFNEVLKDVEYDSTYRCDFIIDIDDMNVGVVTELASKLENIVAQGIEDPMLAIENICLSKREFEIFGKNEDTISFNIDGVKYVQFKCKDDNELYDFLQNAWDDEDIVKFNIVGKPTINEYNGIRTPQIIIEDNLVIEKFISSEEDEW